MSSCISAIGIANPANKFKQQSIYRFMANAAGLDESNSGRLKGIYDHSGIEYRYSVIPDFGMDNPDDFQFFPPSANLEPFISTQARMALYQREAVNIAADAVKNCFSALPDNMAQLITHIITVSCTGMYAPGLD